VSIIVYPIAGSSQIESGYRSLYIDNCDSETLPTGATTSGTITYNDTNKTRVFSNGSEYSQPSLLTIADYPVFSVLFKSPPSSFSYGLEIIAFVNNIRRFSLAFQPDGNIVVYQNLPIVYGGWNTGGGNFAANQTWFVEVYLSINGFRAIFYRNVLNYNYNLPLIPFLNTGENPAPALGHSVRFSLSAPNTTELMLSQLSRRFVL
jgi:hypothetical protein